jgi:transcriptional regulator with XRE-family HTH domain
MGTLRSEREKRGWSQAELARRAGMHPATVSLIERGRMTAYPHQLVKLTRAFGMSKKAAACLIEDMNAGEKEVFRWPPELSGPFKKHDGVQRRRNPGPARTRAPRKKKH